MTSSARSDTWPRSAFEGRADIRSDVYALGLTLYEMPLPAAAEPAFDEGGHAQLAADRLVRAARWTRLIRNCRRTS